MLNDRAQTLLKSLIERYLTDGQPVGSRSLSKFSGLELSPASIRNIMADLEETGFLASPHTSAGRVPTPKGLRFFVDSLMTIQPLDNVEISRLEERMLPADPQRAVQLASQLLSDLTRFAGVVAVPRLTHVSLKHVEFVKLSDKRVLLIIVASTGEVQNRVLLTERAFSTSELLEAANYINEHYAGEDFDTLRDRLLREVAQLHQDISGLMKAVAEAGVSSQSQSGEGVVVSGERNLLNVEDLSSNVTSLRRLFDMFERKTLLLELLDRGAHAEGVQIFIGGESQLAALDECSVVTAPYEVNGQVVGTVGVIGPTRMAYERVIPIVDITARLLSTALSDR